MKAGLLDVVVVAYRSVEDLEALLRDLPTMTDGDYRLHLFDNTGNPKTLTIAWNDLAAAGDGEHIVFLNTDIRLSPGWNGRLVLALDGAPSAGVVLPKPVGHDWPCLIDPSRQPFPSHQTAPAPGPDAMAEIARKWKDDAGLYGFGGECNAAFYATLMRRSLWAELKGFDERFRFYGQDHDFQRRAYKRGLQSVIVNRCPVWHRCAGSVAKAAGHVDFNDELRHHGATKNAIQSGRMPEWDAMDDRGRAAVRTDPLYNRMPGFGK